MKQIIAIAIALLFGSFVTAQEDQKYVFGPDSFIQNVPQGEIAQGEILKSKIFPGTVRRYSVYVPKQYDPEKPAALMVFQDGHAYENQSGSYRAPVVMDNLIARGEMPVTIGVFVDPGHKTEKLPEKRGWRPQPANRSFEYDTLSDDYAKFLLDEVLPPVLDKYNIDPNPERWAICGASSGGICAFTVAWQRPDKFRKVLSHIGSFVNIRHGDTYPGIIRKTEKKPIRVFLQDGSGDLDNEHENWPLANQQMAKALAYKKYDFEFVYGTEAHNGKHGGAILPDSMRWLWRGDADAKEASLSITPAIQTAKWAVQWWMPRHEEKLAARKEMEKVDLLFVGDSITHGWEKGGKSVFDKYYADRNVLNIGFSGDRTEHVLWRIHHGAIDDINPKLAVVMIGTNNTGHRMDPADETALGIQFILGELKNRLPNTKVLLLAVFPRDKTATGKHRMRNDEINERIKKFADDKSVFFLDIADKFLDENGELPKSIMPDMLHPNAKGYKIWADAMEPMIEKLMGKSGKAHSLEDLTTQLAELSDKQGSSFVELANICYQRIEVSSEIIELGPRDEEMRQQAVCENILAHVKLYGLDFVHNADMEGVGPGLKEAYTPYLDDKNEEIHKHARVALLTHQTFGKIQSVDKNDTDLLELYTDTVERFPESEYVAKMMEAHLIVLQEKKPDYFSKLFSSLQEAHPTETLKPAMRSCMKSIASRILKTAN